LILGNRAFFELVSVFVFLHGVSYSLEIEKGRRYNFPHPWMVNRSARGRPMPIDSVPSLIEALRESRSLRPAHLEEISRELQNQFQNPRLLAKVLLDRGWLTAYQLNQIFQGRGGDLRIGPYILLQRIGEGGMGQVFKAWHRHLDRIVALKVIRKDKLDNLDTVRRFQREIEVAARLSHPNIVSAYDAGEVGGSLYVALEYVEGSDLAQLVKAQGPLPVAQACDFVRQAALGLQHAYERGFVHRDIKPSNLLMTRGCDGPPRVEPGIVKILDMGLARVQGPANPNEELTQFQATLGTPDFISPEQARDARTADVRSDLYSLGCTFYYLLTSKVPFPEAAPMEKLLKHWMEEPVPVEERRPELAPEVADVVRKLMAKRPEDRFQAPIEVVAALARLTAVEVPAGTRPARPKSDPLRPGRIPTPLQETIVPSSSEDTDEGPIIHIEYQRQSPRGNAIQFVIACVTVAALTMLLIMLLRMG
jgi:serine/threonine protein kinase